MQKNMNPGFPVSQDFFHPRAEGQSRQESGKRRLDSF